MRGKIGFLFPSSASTDATTPPRVLTATPLLQASYIDSTITPNWHPSLLPTLTLEAPHVDFVVRGQDDDALLDLVQHIESRSAPDLGAGMGFRRGGKLIGAAEWPFKAIVEMPPKALDPADFDIYERACGRSWTIYTPSFDCPFNCAYCTNAGITIAGGTRCRLNDSSKGLSISPGDTTSKLCGWFGKEILSGHLAESAPKLRRIVNHFQSHFGRGGRVSSVQCSRGVGSDRGRWRDLALVLSRPNQKHSRVKRRRNRQRGQCMGFPMHSEHCRQPPREMCVLAKSSQFQQGFGYEAGFHRSRPKDGRSRWIRS